MPTEIIIILACTVIGVLITVLLNLFDKSTALINAAEKGDSAKVNLILTANPELVNTRNILGWTPLLTACYFGRNDTVALLIEKGAKINDSGITPLHYAGTREIAELLIKKGANVNARDTDGKTPLFYANKRKRSEIAYLLRQHGGQA